MDGGVGCTDSLVALMFFIAVLVIALSPAGCATRGPSSIANGSAARTNFGLGSNLYLGHDGDWSGSSAQKQSPSGLYQTDDQQSQITPGNGSAARISANAVGAGTGGDMELTIKVKFGPLKMEEGTIIGITDADVAMNVLNGAFYQYATAIAPMQQAELIAGA